MRKKLVKKAYYERLQKLYDLMTWLAIGIALPMSLLSNNIIHLLFGIQYQEAAGVLQIHIWATLFVFLGVATAKYLIAENYTKILFLRTFTGAIINIILNIMVISQKLTI